MLALAPSTPRRRESLRPLTASSIPLRAGLCSDRRAQLVRPLVERCKIVLAGFDELGRFSGQEGQERRERQDGREEQDGREGQEKSARLKRARGRWLHSDRARLSCAAVTTSVCDTGRFPRSLG